MLASSRCAHDCYWSYWYDSSLILLHSVLLLSWWTYQLHCLYWASSIARFLHAWSANSWPSSGDLDILLCVPLQNFNWRVCYLLVITCTLLGCLLCLLLLCCLFCVSTESYPVFSKKKSFYYLSKTHAKWSKKKKKKRCQWFLKTDLWMQGRHSATYPFPSLLLLQGCPVTMVASRQTDPASGTCWCRLSISAGYRPLC